jgi:hypothetical protein
MVSITSPGISRTSRKTTTVIPSTTGTASASRFRM